MTDVTDRIESVEADLNKITHLQTELSELQERVEGIEEASGRSHSEKDDARETELKELEQRVSFLWDAVLAIRNFLEAEHGIELKEYIEEVDTDGHTLESG